MAKRVKADLRTKETAERFKVLSAGARLAILELLKHGPMKVTEITQALGASQPAVSQHLKVLKAAGLVTDRKEGYWVSYALNHARLLEYKRELERVCRCGCEGCASSERLVLEEYKTELEEELKRVEQQLAELEGESGR